MKKLLILIALMIVIPTNAEAAASSTSKVEKIDLNIKEHEMAITFLSLSEGEAVLVQGPNSKNILVNIGGKGTKAELEDWLKLYGVKEIETLILSKNKLDHSLPELKSLMDRYHIKELAATAKLAAEAGLSTDPQSFIPVTAWTEGTKKEIFPDLISSVQYAGKEQNEGLDIVLDFFHYRVFLMTSLSLSAQETLLQKRLAGINIFKVPSGGKNDLISEELIEYLNPEISILISSGNDPIPNILNYLQGIWSEIYSTKKHGTVTLKFTDSKYEVFTLPVKTDE